MQYDRKIKYFDYIEKGERVRNGGFVKLERREDVCYISMQISGFCELESSTLDVFVLLEGQEEKLGEILLLHGKGSLQLRRWSKNICSGLEYDKLEAFRIPMTSERELYCRISEKVKQPESAEGHINYTAEQQKVIAETSAQTVKRQEPVTENRNQTTEQQESVAEDRDQTIEKQEPVAGDRNQNTKQQEKVIENRNENVQRR